MSERKLNSHCGLGLAILSRCVTIRAPVGSFSKTNYSQAQNYREEDGIKVYLTGGMMSGDLDTM